MGKDTLVTIVTRVLCAALGLLTNIFVARTLGAAGNGVYAYVVTAAALLVNALSLGIGVANVVLLGQRRYKVGEVLSLSLLAAGFLGLVAAAIAWAAVSAVPALAPPLVKGGYLYVVACAAPFLLLVNYLANVALGRGNVLKYNLVGVFQAFAILLALLGLAPVLPAGEKGRIWAWAIGVTGGACCSLALVARGAELLLPSIRLVKDALGFGFKAHLGNVFGLLNYRLSFLLLGSLVDAKHLGYYAVAISLSEATLYIPSSAALALFARTSSRDLALVNRLTALVCRHTVLLTAIIVAAGLSMGKLAVLRLYGAKYLDAVPAMYVLLCGMIFLATSKVLSSDLTGRGRPLIPTLSTFLALLVNIGLMIALVPRWGVLGAATAAVAAYGTDAAVQMCFHLGYSGNRLTDLLFVRREDLRWYFAFGSSTTTRLWRLARLSRA